MDFAPRSRPHFRNGGIVESIANEALGHAAATISYGRYAKSLEIEALKTAIEGAGFDGLDLHWLGRESHVESQVWLTDVLRRINDHPASRIDELLPWNWKKRHDKLAA